MPLYHRETGFPASFTPPAGRLLLRYSKHALRAARDDRYGDMSGALPGEILTVNAKLIEVETDEQGKRTKLVYRVGATTRHDLVLAVVPRPDRWLVTTVWANEINDNHTTLDPRKYVRGVRLS